MNHLYLTLLLILSLGLHTSAFAAASTNDQKPPITAALDPEPDNTPEKLPHATYVLKHHPNIAAILHHAKGLSPDLLAMGLHVYACAQQKGFVQSPYLGIIDFSEPSSEPRFWVINLNTSEVPFDILVAHGMKTGALYAKHFSNQDKTHESSIGVYRTGEPYTGSDGYSMHLIGLEKGFDNNIFKRSVVIHGAKYVSQEFVKLHGRLGRSWGCPAVSIAEVHPLIHTIKNGSIILAYYPDPHWLKTSTYLHCQLKSGQSIEPIISKLLQSAPEPTVTPAPKTQGPKKP